MSKLWRVQGYVYRGDSELNIHRARLFYLRTLLEMTPEDNKSVIHCNLSITVTNTKLVEMIIEKLQETKGDLHPDIAIFIWNILNAKGADEIKKILVDELKEINTYKYRYLNKKEAEDKQYKENIVDGFNGVI